MRCLVTYLAQDVVVASRGQLAIGWHHYDAPQIVDPVNVCEFCSGTRVSVTVMWELGSHLGDTSELRISLAGIFGTRLSATTL